MTRESFYITGGTLPGTAPCYVERVADAELLQGILSGAYVYVLDSRQMGKSSLSIRTLGKLEDAGIRTAFVDLTKFGVRNITPEQWFVAMLREVGRALGIAPKLADFWRENVGLAPVQRFFGALQDAALANIPGRIAIFIDEIDVTRSLPFDTDEFFAGIRQCYIGRATSPELSRLTFSLFGTATPAELIEDTRVSPFNVGQRVELQDFGYQEALVLAKDLPGDSKSVLQRILYWTGGHPYLTQRLCQLISQEGTSANVDAACRSLFFDRRAKESDDNLAFVRNRLLKNDVDLAALLELYGKVRTGKSVRDDETNPLCSVLKMSGVTRVENGNLKVRNRIYAQVFDRDWIRQNLPDAESRRQRTAYRRGLVRATGIAALAVLVVGGLAVYGFSQARIARAALSSAKSLTESLQSSERRLQDSLQRTSEALGLADRRRVTAEEAQHLAKQSATQAALQGQLAKSAAINARDEAAHAKSASGLADSRLSTSLVSTGMQRLDAGDPSGALEPLTTALKLDRGDPYRSAMHRMRLAYALRSASTLRQVWSGSKAMIDAEFLPDQKSVLTANLDGNVRIWNSDSGKALTPAMIQPGLTCVALSQDGRRILTGGSNGDARWWDAKTGKQLRLFGGEGAVQRVGISEDGSKVVIGNHLRKGDTDVYVWDPNSGKRLSHPYNGFNAGIEDLVFSPTGKRLVVACGNFLAWSLDLGDGAGDHSVSTCYSAHQALFVHEGRMLLINGAGEGNTAGTAQLCQPTGAAVVKYKAFAFQDGRGSVFRLSRDGESVLTATDSGTLQMYDLRTGERVGPTIRSHAAISDCDLSSDEKLISAANADGTVRTWSVASGEQVGSFLWHGAGVTKVRFDAAGTRLLTCSKDGTARIWQPNVSGLEQVRVGPEKFQGDPKYFWTPRGDLVASGIASNYRWSRNGGWKTFLPGYRVVFNDLALGYHIDYPYILQSSFSRMLLSRDDAIRVYDFDRDRFITPALRSKPGFRRDQSCFGLSFDKRFLYDEYSPSRIKIYDLDHDARLVRELHVPYRLRLSQFYFGQADARDRSVGFEVMAKFDRVITNGTMGELDLWSLSSGMHVASIRISKPIRQFTFSPDGSMLLADSLDKGLCYLQVFRTQDGKALSPRIQHGDPFMARFSGDGSRLLAPGVADLWDTHTWQRIDTHSLETLPTSAEDFEDLSGTMAFNPRSHSVFAMKTGEILKRSLLNEELGASAFSRDSRYLAVGSATNVFVYDFEESHPVVGPLFTGSFGHVGFTPDSKLLITLTAGRLRLWDPQTGEEVLPAIPSISWPIFSADGKSFACRVGQGLVVNTLPSPDLNLPRLDLATEALSQTTLKKIDPSLWLSLLKKFASASSPSEALRSGDEASALTTRATYSVEDVLRDTGIHSQDVAGLLGAAQAAARADQWSAAGQSIDEAVRKGAKGAGVSFFQGVIALQEKRYTTSVSALESAMAQTESHAAPGHGKEIQEAEARPIADRLFQASVGAKEFTVATAALSEPFVGDSVTTATRNSTFAILGEAAGGNMPSARERFLELVQRLRGNEDQNSLEGLLPYLGSASATLDAGSDSANYFVAALSKTDDPDPAIGPALTLELARIQRDEEAEKRLSKIDPGDLEPEYLMARALICQRNGRDVYRMKLQSCIKGCQAIINENDCQNLPSALKIIRAVVLQREAQQRVASL